MKKIIIAALIGAVILITGAIVVASMQGEDYPSNELGYALSYQSKGLTPHAPIYIDGNSQFTAENGVSNPSAAGTESDPYIIENWDINASTANGIEIRNTNAYFIIRNCVIHDGGSRYDGIYFHDATNGKIDKVTSYNNYDGIVLFSSSNNIITNCDVYNNDYGIRLSYWFVSFSKNNNITNCAVYNNSFGIYLADYSNNNQITNCSVYNNSHGIELYGSSNNIITNCDVYNNNYGIWLFYSSNNEIHYNNIYNNTDCGIYNYDIYESQYQVNATYNWWGSANGPGADGANPVSANVIAIVIYNPWLTEPVEDAGWQPPESGVGSGEKGENLTKPFEIPWLYILLSIIIIIVLVGVGISIKRRKKALPPEKPAGK